MDECYSQYLLDTDYSIHPFVASVVLLVVQIRYRLLVIFVINLIFDAPVYAKIKISILHQCCTALWHCCVKCKTCFILKCTIMYYVSDTIDQDVLR